MTATMEQTVAAITLDDDALVRRLSSIERMVTTRGKNIAELQSEIVDLTREKHELIAEQIRRLQAKMPAKVELDSEKN